VILARNTAQRAAAPNRLHHRTTLLLDGVLYSRALSLFLAAYQPTQPAPPPARSTGLWNLPGYGKPAKKPAAFPQPLENAPAPHPRFPQLPQPLLATRQRASHPNHTKQNPATK
jgi:hypothetical protein